MYRHISKLVVRAQILSYPNNRLLLPQQLLLTQSSSFHRSFSSALPPKLDNIGRLNHVAIAVKDIMASKHMYENVFKLPCTDVELLEEHGVRVSFIDVGNTKLELLEMYGDDSPLKSFFKKNPLGGIHHICLEVKHIRKAIVDLKASGVVVLNEEPKIGAHGKPVTFLHPKSCDGILIELEEV